MISVNFKYVYTVVFYVEGKFDKDITLNKSVFYLFQKKTR